jgi:hypothetical protein
MSEIKRIDEKVKQQLKMLDEHEEMRNSHFEELIAKENAREKPRVTYLAELNKKYADSKLITEASRDLMQFTTQWNTVKQKLDESSGLEGTEENAEVFAAALAELQEIKPHDLFKKVARVKRIKRWRKFDTPLRTDLLNQYHFMQRVYKNGPKFLKRMGMSEKQKAAADSASRRMKARWGSF